MGKWNGAIPWQRFPSSIDITTNTLTAAAVNSFSDFTGINSINPTVGITANPSSVCQNEPASLTANATGDAPLSYLWSPGGATTSTLSPSTATAGTINYSVTVTDGNGFTASAGQDVVVNATPQGNLSSNGSICSGDAAQLTFSATSGMGPFTVVYFDGVANRTQTGVISGTAFNASSNPTTNTTYTLVSVTDNNGCSRSSGFTGNSATITINESPNIISQPSSQTVCEGDDVIFSVNATGTGLTYQWQKDGQDISDETGSSFTLNNVTTANTGGYTVVVNGTCPPAVTSDAATLTINTTPVISATAINDIPGDANNCSASVAFGLNVTVEGTPAPTLAYKIGNTEIISPHVFPLGTTTVIVNATNDCGTTSATFDVTVKDVTAPIPDAASLANISGECSVTVNTAPRATDNCSGTIAGTTTDALAYTTQGTHVIHWSFDDGNGNISTATQNVVIHDVTAPAVPVLVDVTGECSATVATPTTTDNCSGTIAGTTTDALAYTTQGTHVIHWSFDDGNGNISTAIQNVVIHDVTAPAVPVLADVTGECSATVATPTTTDNCSGIITGTTTDALTYNTQGTHVIHWSFNDGNGNTSTTTQNVVIDDVTAPAVPVLAAVTGECSATVATPTTTDNCSGIIAGTTTDPLTYNTQGTHVIHWSFNDGNGNTSTATQNVVIDDVTPPVVTCPPNSPFVRNTNPGVCNYKVVGSEFNPVGFGDNCAGTTIKNNFNNSNSLANVLLPKGNNTIIWTATDVSGNTASCNITIKVEDHENPAITCPANIVLPANQNTATWTEPTGSDNCPGWTVTRTGPAPGSIFAPGITTISYTVTDASGNQNSCSFTVTNNNSSVASCTNSNSVLYFGYAGDQTATITATPTTGTGPYTISFTMSRPLLCNQVNDAGDELWTTGGDGGTTINNICPVSPGLYPVSTKTIVSGSYSVSVTLMADADITATITDAAGSVTTCTNHIHADDVRCFAGNSGNSKITICHKQVVLKTPV
jgi:hypothetical protein